MTLTPQSLVGRSYTFEDGKAIRILQIKPSDKGHRVHYYQIEPGALEKKLVMEFPEFVNNFGHLFQLNSPDAVVPEPTLVYNGKPVTKL